MFDTILFCLVFAHLVTLTVALGGFAAIARKEYEPRGPLSGPEFALILFCVFGGTFFVLIDIIVLFKFL